MYRLLIWWASALVGALTLVILIALFMVANGPEKLLYLVGIGLVGHWMSKGL